MHFLHRNARDEKSADAREQALGKGSALFFSLAA
jgi:hypothetical protein